MDMTITRLIKLPPQIKGVTVMDEEGDYNIYLNKDLAGNQMQRTYEHEIQHVNQGDFYSNEPAQRLEIG